MAISSEYGLKTEQHMKHDWTTYLKTFKISRGLPIGSVGFSSDSLSIPYPSTYQFSKCISETKS